MMSPPELAKPADGEHTGFEKSCNYCGARFHVDLLRLHGHNTPQEFCCPECGRCYEVRARAAPGVRLLARRTDGKKDRYQETMF
ncbi:MAG TPA: hypothetical protein VLJ19_05095 [Variovorax sp.]|nr:hypothetical protein [Variovorax sp.]